MSEGSNKNTSDVPLSVLRPGLALCALLAAQSLGNLGPAQPAGLGRLRGREPQERPL